MGTNNKAMLCAYPDSMGDNLSYIVSLLQREGMRDAFGSVYILPSMFHTDLDRGFSVQSYDLEESLATKEDLAALKGLGIDLKLDFILNHMSVLSPQFQDLLKNGESSRYIDFFIDWNRFWEGCGTLNGQGCIEPDPQFINDMFFRKPGLPILMVELPEKDGCDRVASRNLTPYWNTFYQRVWKERGETKYLGQMDLNVKSELVWEFYDATLRKLSSYGALIVRLDAFAYVSKVVGKRNFLNEPETWDILARLRGLADQYGVVLLPEIHASYGDDIHVTLAQRGYLCYDFFLPGLIIDAIENRSGEYLSLWIRELTGKRINTVNMLGCHDGIPLLDLKGLLPDDRIQGLIDTVVSRGGIVKDLRGARNVYYQVNAAYFSALDENEDKLLLARAIQMFTPGKPQVWYLDLLAQPNDNETVSRAGEGGHKEINRTNLTAEQVNQALGRNVVKQQLELLRLRNTHPAFVPDARIDVSADGTRLTITWRSGDHCAALLVDFADCHYIINI